jgi:hypothetical protein
VRKTISWQFLLLSVIASFITLEYNTRTEAALPERKPSSAPLDFGHHAASEDILAKNRIVFPAPYKSVQQIVYYLRQRQ